MFRAWGDRDVEGETEMKGCSGKRGREGEREREREREQTNNQQQEIERERERQRQSRQTEQATKHCLLHFLAVAQGGVGDWILSLPQYPNPWFTIAPPPSP